MLRVREDHVNAQDTARVEFCWSGTDENDLVNGHGWLDVKSDPAQGFIAFDSGDESGLAAQRQP